MKQLLIILCLLLSISFIKAQAPLPEDNGTIVLTTMKIHQETSTVNKQLSTGTRRFYITGRPVLSGLQGAPPPFYKSFWICSNGQYSRQDTANFTFRQAKNYTITAYSNGQYTSGGPPPPVRTNFSVGSRNIALNNNTTPGVTTPLTLTTNFPLPSTNNVTQVEHALVPGNRLVQVITYGNPYTNNVQNGTIYYFYNEHRGADPALLYHTNHHNNSEQITQGSISDIQSTLSQDLQDKALGYKQYIKIVYSGLQAQQSRNVFIDFVVLTPGILPTHKIETYCGIQLDSTTNTFASRTSSFQYMAAYDPNLIEVDSRRLAFKKQFGFNTLTYTVRFRNDGVGPATNIIIAQAVPPALSLRQVEVLSSHPPLPGSSPTDTAGRFYTTLNHDTLRFHLKKVYLPGSRQPGLTQPDSANGYITYRFLTSGRKQRNIRARASIYFDQNPPIETGVAKTNLVYYRRWGVMAGLSPQLQQTNFVRLLPISFLRVLRTRFKPKGFYNQPEFALQRLPLRYEGVQGFQQQLQWVPIHTRYNLGRWLGVGAGICTQWQLSQQANGQAELPPVNSWDQRLSMGPYFSADAGLSHRGLRLAVRLQGQRTFAKLKQAKRWQWFPQLGVQYTF